jgi:RNA-directed DNA polymerase
MAAMATLTGASPTDTETWEAILWPKVTANVFRLQMRIAKAVRIGRWGKAKALQRLLVNSFSAKVLAVKRVTQNSGNKTPGVDGVVWKTAKQKLQAAKMLKRRGYQPLPLRRISIPKQDSKKLRNLHIPAMFDRAQQALHLLGLEPIAETLADHNSYGFRPKRSAADAIGKCFILLARKSSAKWILNGDIKACFDTIDHKWLCNNIPMDREILNKWLIAGYIENQTLYPIEAGIGQGSIISPTILTITLAGLEEAITAVASRTDKVHLVTYADDFIVTGSTKEVLENKIKPVISKFLRERGLELSQDKTTITHIEKEGFDFLGFHCRKYKTKLLIKPQKERVKKFLNMIRKTIKTSHSIKTEELIVWLNTRITGWANYYRHVVAKKIFGYVDHKIFWALWKWIKRRHSQKNTSWRIKKYFCNNKLRNWIFFAEFKDIKGNKQIIELAQAACIKIERHIKIKADANPYDSKFKEYFAKRRNYRMKNSKNIGANTTAVGLLGM